MTPIREGFDNSEKFFIMCVVVDLGRSQLAGMESNWMEDSSRRIYLGEDDA